MATERAKAARRIEREAAATKETASALAERTQALEQARARECEAIEAALRPLGLSIRAMDADGHCLFHAVADQLKVTEAAQQQSHFALRVATAKHMRENRSRFEPFLLPTMEALGCATFDEYCHRLGTTAMYGGEPEISALSALLDVPIVVHSRGAPPRRIGGGGSAGRGFGGAEAARELNVTFHKDYLVSGDHYNSTVPNK